MIGKSKLVLKQLGATQLFGAHQQRFFAAQNSSEYQSFEDNIFYTPERQIVFQNGKSSVFDQTKVQGIKYVPYEAKEITIKNCFGVFGVHGFNTMFHPFPLFTALGTGYFGFNWIYQLYRTLGHSVIKIELLEDGKSVNFVFKTGGEKVFKIQDIVKQRHEKDMVQTFEEGFFFPVKVQETTYYIHGSSQEAISNGEAFRAIINGQSIKV